MDEQRESLSLPDAEVGPAADSPSFEKHTVEEPVFIAVLGDVLDAFDRDDLPFLVIGGVASAVWGRPRWTQDIDVMVRPVDARRALDALERSGFATEETFGHWLYKGVKDDVIVDVLFQSSGGIYLDEEMLERRVLREIGGMKLPLAAPEALIVMKAVAHEEETPRYWHDALSIIARAELDWEYLLKRARLRARRILALLVDAQSNDLVVPDGVIRTLFEVVVEDDAREEGRGGTAA